MHPLIRRWFVLCIALIACAQLPAAYAQGAFRFTESAVNGGKSDWGGADEDQVFYRMLTNHEEGHTWTIKIGKGGQIYSIKTPELGELIAPQRTELGQWVDEVFQHVIPMLPQKDGRKSTVVDGDIHQAGYYSHSDYDENVHPIPRSVYSPLFGWRFDATTNSASYISWPQHAHLPRKHGENQVLINETIKDLGGGVVEITVEIDKWGGARFDKFNLPWSAWRLSTVPVQVVSTRDGGYRVVNKAFRDNDNSPRLTDGETGGWLALVSGNSPSSRGIGIVFGKDPRELDEKSGFVRWGTYGPPRRPEGIVATVRRDVRLEAGESLYYRYYLVIGTLAEIQAKGNALESKVALERVKRRPEDSTLMPICGDARQGLSHNCGRDQAPIFSAYREFVPGSRPLFLLQKAGTSEYLITDNPYEISFDPTDGTTKYVDLLGWVMPQERAADTCRFLPVANAVAAANPRPQVGQRTTDLRVVSANADKCPPGGTTAAAPARSDAPPPPPPPARGRGPGAPPPPPPSR